MRTSDARHGDTARKNRGRPVVLLLDPDPETDQLARLSEFRVVRAADMRECIELAERLLPDAIVVDLASSSLDGGELVLMLKQHPRACNVPVIFLSPREHDVPGVLSRIEDVYSLHADPVTGLPPKRAFRRRVVEEVARSRRSGAPLSVLIVEIDQRSSRSPRDLVLRELAIALRNELRTADALFRYDDNAFAAVLPDTDVSTAFPAAERVRETIRTGEFAGERENVTASVGIAEVRPGWTPEELIAGAEIALYRARESGGDRTWRSDDPRRHGLNPDALAQELTQREWDVLAHLARRRTEQEIARRLGIRTGTVRSHKARIRRKLHIAANVRLADFASENFASLAGRVRRTMGPGDGGP